MSTVSIRPRTLDDDAQTVDIWNRIYPEYPPETVEKERHFIANTPKTAHVERMVAERDGQVVGNSVLLQMFWTEHPDRYNARVGVDPELHGQGIGSSLYEPLLSQARKAGAARLYTHVQEGDEESEQFAARRGFTSTGRQQRMSRLDVHTANLEGYEGIEDRVRVEGLRLATLAEVGPDDEDFLRALYELDSETVKDVPSSEPFSMIPYENWKADLEAPGSSPETLWIALDEKKPVGVATLMRQGNTAWNAYTGVARAYRGRGVARALKLRTIEWSRENGVDYIYTGNDMENKRMLAVNIRLGYQPLPAFLEMTKDLTEG